MAETDAFGGCGKTVNPFDRSPARTGIPPIFEGVPARARLFVGREETLDDLDAALRTEGRVVICGLAGVGKTSLAADFAHASRGDHAGVWWVQAARRETLIRSLAGLGARLDPAIATLTDAAAARAALLLLAKSPEPWLLVYDGVRSPAILEGLWPPAGTHLVVTTRWAHWAVNAKVIPLDVLSVPAAMMLLTKCTGRYDFAAASRLADDLGRLPLALEQAASCCRHLGLSFETYRILLPDILRRTSHAGDDQPDIFATFDRAIRQAAHATPEAGRLLGILAFFAPDDIPVDLIGKRAMSPLERGEALAALLEVSLLRIENGGLGVHRLVQQVVRRRLEAEGEAEDAGALAIRLAAAAFPSGERDPSDVRLWPLCARLLPHALSALSFAGAERKAARAASVLLNQAGLYLKARGDFREAEPLLRRSLALAESVHGPSDPKVAVRLSNLSLLLQDMAQFEEAESLIRRALVIDETVYGQHHPEFAADLDTLAGLLQETDRFAEAEELLRRALTLAETIYGTEHTEVARHLGSLAGFLYEQDRPAEAELLYRRALAIDEAICGPDHPTVGISLNNLAALLKSTDRPEEAEPLMIRALTIAGRAFGPGHPTVAARLMSLASLLQETGRHDAAEPLMRRALVIDEEVFGSAHRRVADDLLALAGLLEETNRFAESESSLRRALAIDEAARHHREMIIDLNRLAHLLGKAGRTVEAERLALRGLAICERTLGADHYATGKMRSMLERIRSGSYSAEGPSS